MGGLSKPAATLVAAAVLIAGGGAYALAGSSSGTITACVSHKGGTLYKAKKCHKHDSKISWNKQGLTGSGGQPGLQGPAGPTASGYGINNLGGTPATVPALAFFDALDLTMGHDHTGLLTVTFPARLVANATAIITNIGSAAQTVECRLAEFPQPANSQLPFGEAARETVAGGVTATAPMTAAVDVTPGTYNVEVQCANFTGTATVQYSKGNLSVIATAR